MTAILTVEDVTAGFGANQVLHGITLSVQQGEIAGIFGLNGAGKSVTMKTIAGLVPAWSGRITFNGTDITNVPAERRVAMGMGHVPQGRQVFPDLTVEENLRIGAYTSRRRDRAGYAGRLDRVFAQFPILAERRAQVAGTMSGGQQASLAVARALINDPTLILVDEPSAGLAPIIVSELFDILKQVAATGVTMVLVEQNVSFGLRLVQRAHLLQTGRVVHSDDVSRLDQDTLARHLGIGRMLGAGASTALAARGDEAAPPPHPAASGPRCRVEASRAMTYEALDVPVDGGLLRVGRWGTGERVLLAIHGITANHISFRRLAEELGDDVTLIAPDLRGRGRSGALPPPYGIRAHAEDVRAVLDHLDVEQAVVLGHSMGAWVATTLAITHPARVSRLVIVDGGVALPIPDGVSVDDMLTAVLGAAMARLSMTFESRDAYLDFWRAHPALSGDKWSDDLEAYIDYDLVGEAPSLRSSVSVDAVRADATEQLTDSDVRDGIDRIPQPAVFLRAPRGLDDGAPLYPREVLEALRPQWKTVTDIVDVDDVNHYTIVIGSGAPAVAERVRASFDD